MVTEIVTKMQNSGGYHLKKNQWHVLNVQVRTSEMQVRMMKQSLALLYRIVSEKNSHQNAEGTATHSIA